MSVIMYITPVDLSVCLSIYMCVGVYVHAFMCSKKKLF
jgi:hypothetical protein